jgi:hypothetical protein
MGIVSAPSLYPRAFRVVLTNTSVKILHIPIIINEITWKIRRSALSLLHTKLLCMKDHHSGV